MKKNVNLKKILMGIGFLLGVGTAQAQISAPTGSTHCTVYQDDCTLTNAKVQVTFTINPGGITPVDPLDEYKVQIKLYRGVWTQAGWAFTVANESNIFTDNSPVVSSPANVTTPTFFSTARIYTVSRNGAYRAQTTLLQNTVSNGWVVRYTTPLSAFYGVNDVTLEHYGDINEVALIENLNVAPYFGYSINGKTSSSPVPTIITCPAVPLSIKNVTGGADNPGTSTITVQKGSLSGTLFDPGSNPIQSVTLTATNADQNLYSLFSGLSTYAGALRVSYRIPDDVCGSTTTPISKTMTISVATAAFLNDFQAPTGSAVVSGCGSSATTKTISPTWSITAAMPSSTVMNTFRCQLKTATGWQGATSAGIADLTYAGNYSIDVYEVSPSTGVRLTGAPSLFLKTGSAASNDQITFGDYGYSAGFNASSAGPFFVDQPADPSGLGSGYNYFRDFYEAARTNSVTVGNLTAFSARVFCAEVSQYPEGGCVVSRKSFFRIANNGLASGGTARMAAYDMGETNEDYPSLEVYPNPTKGEFIIPVTEDDANVSIRIMDNLGKEVLSLSDLKDGNISIEKLTAGIYFYTIQKNGEVYRGKVVKE